MKKYDNFKSQLRAILEGIEDLDKFNRPITRSGLINQFNTLFELTWKTLKEYLNEQGYSDVKNPRAIFKKAFYEDLIDNEEAWLDMLKSRNDTSHIYNEELAIGTCDKIKDVYIQEFIKLDKVLSNLIN